MEQNKIKILIVDDDDAFCEAKSSRLADEGYGVKFTTNPLDAIKIASKEQFDIVLTDLNMNEMNGIELLKNIKGISATTEVILITGFASIETAIEAIKSGAYDYITKSSSHQELTYKILHAIEKKINQEQIDQLKNTLKERFGFKNIIGKNEKMQDIYHLIETVSNVDVPVLIRGETGTGKELVAKAIHFNGDKRVNPFVVVNCAAISPTLVESELFGHERGAFTGAIKGKMGKLDMAVEGTIFLDEIGDMSIELQAKLLRVLQDKTYERVGGVKLLSTNARIISATNRDLEELIKEGKFREDLFYRINVVNINLPPLRERIDDIKMLAYHFLEKSNLEFNKKIDGFSDQAMDILLLYSWPGNIRELENLVKKLVILAKDKNISAENLKSSLYRQEAETSSTQGFSNLTWEQAEEKFEKEYLISLLKHFNGKLSQSAEKAKIARRTLYQKMQQYNLRKENFIQPNNLNPI